MASMPKHLLFSLLCLAGVSQASSASEFYCCQDSATGRRVCGDTLPAQCRGQSYRVLDSGGNVIREVGPPLTPEQKAQQAAENKRRKEQEEAEREQRRKDQALLDTYTSPKDIDLAQKKAEEDINSAIAAATAQMNVTSAKKKKLDNEAEFYKKKAMPTDLHKELDKVNHEVQLLQELLDVKKKDFDSVRAKYDADRQRYYQLTGRTSTGSPPLRPH